MFMIDMQGTLALATRSSNSRTSDERYCGSCIASTTRSNSEGSASAGPPAESFPGSVRESSSVRPSRPLTGVRTRVPSLLMRSASAGRQINFAVWPASSILVASNEPYDAPKMRVRTFASMLPPFARLAPVTAAGASRLMTVSGACTQIRKHYTTSWQTRPWGQTRPWADTPWGQTRPLGADTLPTRIPSSS